MGGVKYTPNQTCRVMLSIARNVESALHAKAVVSFPVMHADVSSATERAVFT